MKLKIIRQSAEQYLNSRFSIGRDFKSFNQKNDIFNRSIWDDNIKPKKFYKSYDIANYVPKKSKGFDHWDYAFRNASWHLTDAVGERSMSEDGRSEGFTHFYSLGSSGPPKKLSITDPAEASIRVKKAALSFGAGAVGICKVDRRWIYTHNYNRKDNKEEKLDLPESLSNVIVLIIPMDHHLSKTFPSALGGAATGIGYGIGLNASVTLAQFITNLGYEAVASLNDTALSIPMAIAAGLGEYGRHGLLITPEYGPNVRIAKVFTDMPLDVDSPIEYGVKEFCNICRKCADSCPVKAIAQGEPQDKPPNISSLSGIKKWTINAEKCFKFWVGMNTDCAICIRVCPYNKDYSKWWNRIGIRLAGSPLRSIMLWLDGVLKFSKRIKAEHWWNPD